MAIRFYECGICGNLVCTIDDSGNPLSCCGRQMKELRPASTDGDLEKHVPVYQLDGSDLYVKIGQKLHPMEKFHHIEFVVVETTQGFMVQKIDKLPTPEAYFKLNPEQNIINIYIYCNLHGLYSLY